MSENSRKYSNPPIEEALFDIQTRGGAFDKNLFEKFLKESPDYIEHGSLQNIDIDTKTMDQKVTTFGYRGISKDKKQIIQFKKYGFSFSRLKIYDGWEKNYKEALRLWNIYCKVMEPKAITRVATRFINRFHISDMVMDVSKYFKTHIQYSQSISPIWNQMSYRLLSIHSNGIKSHIVFDNKANQNIDIVSVKKTIGMAMGLNL